MLNIRKVRKSGAVTLEESKAHFPLRVVRFNDLLKENGNRKFGNFISTRREFGSGEVKSHLICDRSRSRLLFFCVFINCQ